MGLGGGYLSALAWHWVQYNSLNMSREHPEKEAVSIIDAGFSIVKT